MEVALSEILNLDRRVLEEEGEEVKIDLENEDERHRTTSFNLRNSIGNAKLRIEENIQESLQSDFPL